MTTEEKRNVYALIAQVQSELAKGGITKDKQADAGGAKYKFRGIDDIYNATAQIVSKAGL